jgi:hypothetical protein
MGVIRWKRKVILYRTQLKRKRPTGRKKDGDLWTSLSEAYAYRNRNEKAYGEGWSLVSMPGSIAQWAQKFIIIDTATRRKIRTLPAFLLHDIIIAE